MGNSKASANPQTVKCIELYYRVIAVLPGENIVKALSQPPHCFTHGIARDRSAASIAQRPKIIDAVGVIGVIMGPKDGIDPVNAVH